MAESKKHQITVQEVIEDHLDDPCPRILARVTDIAGKEATATIFKTKKGLVPKLNHTYMAYYKKPGINKETGEPYQYGSFNIAFPVKNEPEPADDTTDDEIDTPFDDEPIPPEPTPQNNPDPDREPNHEPAHKPKYDTPNDPDLNNKALTNAVNFINRLTREVTEDEVIRIAIRFRRFCETGE